MERTIVGVFDSRQDAEAARQELVGLGLPQDRVHVEASQAGDASATATSAGEQRDEGFWDRLVHWFEGEDEHTGEYAEAVRRGSCLLVVDASDSDPLDQVADVLSRHGAVDVDQRVESWRQSGWTGYDAAAPAISEEEMRKDREPAPRGAALNAGQATSRIPVIEETLKVGKRVVNSRGVRIHTRMTERPVEEQVTLRDEHARVERHAVDRPATSEDLAHAFKEGSMELQETAEEAVVSKRARVVEEVEIAKEVTERTEHVQDTVRRSDVEVENLAGRQGVTGASAVAGGTAMGASAVAGGTARGVDSATTGRTWSDAGVDNLNELLRDEVSASETYRQALDKNRNEYGQDARFQQLVRMLEDHERAASELRAMIQQMGGTPANDSGAWGTWASTVMGTARLFGDKAALKALKEGEESGIKDYQSMLQDGAPAEVRNVFSAIVAKEQEHVRTLDQLIDRA